MFLGHHAVAFAAKKVSPRVSLGTLILSAQFIDLLWPLLLLLGLEHVRFAPGITAFSPFDFYDYPLSHSLLAVVIWAAGLGAVYYAIRRSPRGAWVVGACVISHWVLDFISHRPDLPLIPGSAVTVGLGLWNTFVGTVVIEGGMFVAGVILYARSTRAIDRVGTYALWAFVALLVAIYIGSIATQNPVTQEEMGIGGLTQWLLVPWAYWIDRHRRVVSS
jgi:hypothetical protein